jgi:hypothetical protein
LPNQIIAKSSGEAALFLDDGQSAPGRQAALLHCLPRTAASVCLDRQGRAAHLGRLASPLTPCPVRPVRPKLLLLVPLALAGCKAEPTPRSFYNHRDPAVVELQESEGEIRSRVSRFVAALSAGSGSRAMEAMNPSDQLRVMGPSDADSVAVFGRDGLLRAVAAVRRPPNGLARTTDLRVSSSQAMAWFATHVVILPVTTEGRPERLRLSGVFVLDRGDWRLVEAHLSQPALPVDSAATDSTGASSPDSAAAPEEGG